MDDEHDDERDDERQSSSRALDPQMKLSTLKHPLPERLREHLENSCESLDRETAIPQISRVDSFLKLSEEKLLSN